MGGGRATPPAVTDAARRSEPTGSRANIAHVPTISHFLGISIGDVLRRSRVSAFHARDASGQAKIRIDEDAYSLIPKKSEQAAFRLGLDRGLPRFDQLGSDRRRVECLIRRRRQG